MFLKYQNLMRSFTWGLSYFNKQIPRKLWAHQMSRNNVKWLEKRARFHARLLGKTLVYQWPYNSAEVPTNIETLANSELGVVARTLNQHDSLIIS